VKGRIIVGLFASNFERMIRIVQAAENLGKKVVLEGRSVKTNMEIAERAGIFTAKKGTVIPPEAISDYPSDKIVIIATGAQVELVVWLAERPGLVAPKYTQTPKPEIVH
jgi:ribonuclease J